MKLLIALLAATVDAANLRKGGKAQEPSRDSRRLAGHGGHDDGDCHDDPEWCVGSVLAEAAYRRTRISVDLSLDWTRLAANTS